MKKFLTVLLVIAVMFTFSFGTAFAASYGIDEVSTALEAEKALQLGYLANAKTQAVNSYTFDDDGFTVIAGVKYNKASIEAAADKVIADLTTAMNTAINTELNKTYPVDAIDKTVVSNVAAAYLTKDQMVAALKAETETLNKTQAPLTKAFVEGKLAVDITKYDNTKKLYDGNKLTAVQYIEKLTAEAKSAIAAAADKTADADKIAGYEAALATFKTAMASVKTLEDQAIDDGEAVKTVDQAISAWVNAANADLYPVASVADASAFPADFVKNGVTAKYAAFYEAKTSAAKATLFGVEIADINKVTRAEAVAVNNALYAAINDAAKVIKTYAGNDASKVAALSDYAQTLRNAMDVADKYAEVKEYGEKLKKEYYFGIKQYDDAKVDAAVAAAEELVYADLAAAKLGTAKSYLEATTDKGSLSELYAENFELDKFNKAIKDAKAKFIDYIVVYGDNKTAEADKVYAKELYAVAADYDDIKADTFDALDVAQSYAEIEEIMAGAAEDLGGLLLKANEKAVADAQKAYKASLANYAALKASLVDTTKYPADVFDDAVAAGSKLIDEAITVDGVKAAYAEAQAIVDGVKTTEELDAMAKAVVAQINALPYTAKLTAADAATVQAAYDAMIEYLETPGADAQKITNAALLEAKLNAVIAAETKDINDAAADLVKAINKLGSNDADEQALMDMKADVQAVADEAAALAKKIKGINADKVFAEIANGLSKDVKDLQDMVDVEGDYYDLAEYLAEKALILAAKEGATVEEMKAALNAYNNLTDKQKYRMDASVIQMAKVIEYKLGDVVEALKITASSKATKGAITVKWTVKGDATAADGYQIWKSTKKNSGYKKMFTTSKTSYKNTKGLKKGTRYYYKVRAYKVVDGKNVYSDWSNKAFRIAK